MWGLNQKNYVIFSRENESEVFKYSMHNYKDQLGELQGLQES